jgi:hypothetical protein
MALFLFIITMMVVVYMFALAAKEAIDFVKSIIEIDKIVNDLKNEE